MSVSGRWSVRWNPTRVFALAVFLSLAFASGDAMTPGELRPSQARPGCSGKCLDPHPGKFTTSEGQRRDQCWVQVWRRWPDGCTHWQWFDRCNTRWDADAAGRPRVTWTCCVH